ncbi:hypothetical protein Lal_00031247, partial [Lupinus albus]
MIGKWSMISLGKGYYDFSFSSKEDMRSVCSLAWNRKALSMDPRFHSESTKNVTHTMLGQDSQSSSRVLKSYDFLYRWRNNRSWMMQQITDLFDTLLNKLPDQILFERESFAFFVSIEYENLHAFYHGCRTIGHLVFRCRRSLKKPKPK